ncbi:MAG: NAD(P)H-binding protein [Candidatus Dormibacteria bacterium]
MRVLLFGATGNIGTAIARELIARGHAVTAATRGGSGVAGLDVPVRKVDATDPAEVAAAATGQDAIVSAIGPRRGVDDQEAVLVGGARGLIAGARSAGVRRVVVVGGGGSLLVASGERLLDTPDFPAAWRPGALAQAAALELYRAAGDLDWTYISPPFLIEAGERSGRFRLGGDEVLRDPQGVSRITYPDFAIALVDELEQGRAIRRRITLAY